MGARIGRRSLLRGLSLLALAACTADRFNLGLGTGASTGGGGPQRLAQGKSFGSGPVQVALLLPLSGEAASVGTSMARGAELAMDFIAGNPQIADNITLVLKDTGASAQGAVTAAQQAVGEGAALIRAAARRPGVGGGRRGALGPGFR